ncbi:hypothetical protein HDN1F_09450 [gamma proteobacterium HdN1]|nr:hypothetical protein HDN1F_09450 [gamma proteobacterium HdN1]
MFNVFRMNNTKKSQTRIDANRLSLLVALPVVILAHSNGYAASITTQPVDRSQVVGEDVKLTVGVKAKASEKVTYKWYHNYKLISGATQNYYWKGGLTKADAGQYYVRVISGSQNIKSDTITLTVQSKAPVQSGKSKDPVAITTQPANQIVNSGASATFSVKASGSGTLKYSWYFNNAPISGATASTLKVSGVQKANAGTYVVVVSNGTSSAMSNAAKLSVLSSGKNYSATLKWSKPTKREDGSKLSSTDIAGYNIYFATSSTASMSRIASGLSASQTSYVVSNLGVGNNYFAMSTTDKAGREGAKSAKSKITF